MHRRSRRRKAAARFLLLLGLAAAEASATFEIASSGGLLYQGEPFTIRGTVYSNTPIGERLSDRLEASPCLYDRDFPLIAAAGGNTIRTLARVNPTDRAFPRALESSGLFWLAGFPLEPYHDRDRRLNGNLADTIVSDFTAYAEAWADEPHLIGFVFGDGVVKDYPFRGPPFDFYILLDRIGQALDAAGLEHVLLTTSVSQIHEIGSLLTRSQDVEQLRLSFWSFDATGETNLVPLIEDARSRTSKPLLVSSFGIDAYDKVSRSEDAQTQAETARSLASSIEHEDVLGGLWAGLSDEWARGGPDPRRHSAGGEEAPSSPDGSLERGWLGLFGVTRSGVAGLDSLRPREAYFALASVWGGAVVSSPGAPAINPDGVVNYPSDQPVLARGGLFRILGERLASASLSAPDPLSWPTQLGTSSACINGQPAPLVSADGDELRGQVPWEIGAGEAQIVAFQSGAASPPAKAEVRESAPGILPGAVFRPGLPCPVDMYNGVPPGSYLEIYGTGLGAASANLSTGVAATEPLTTLATPAARLAGDSLPVFYSGVFAGAVGVYQTNVKVADDAAPGNLNLRLVQGGTFSNPHLIRVVAAHERAFFGIGPPSPAALTIQEGGPGASAQIEILGAHGFCSLVRLEVVGAPPGVRVSAPVGTPGQKVDVSFSANYGAARSFDTPIEVAGLSITHQRPTRELRLTVLPSQGDIRYRVVSGGWLTGEPAASFELEGRTIHLAGGGGPGRGFNFVTIDARSGLLGKYYNFDTWGDENAVEALENFVLSLPEGELVFAAIADDGELLITDVTRQILKDRLGSELIGDLEYQWSWAIISQVGAERPIAEGLERDRTVDLERVLSLPLL